MNRSSLIASLRSLTVFGTLALVAAGAAGASGCENHDAKAGPTVAAKPIAAPASTDDMQKLCVQVFERSRTCTDDYIPALVDSRAKLDVPKGIAAEVKADRNAVIAQAKQEWAHDSTDPAIAQTCEHIAGQLDDATAAQAPTARGCLTKASCGEYTACIMPVFEKHLAK
jgi:hypothetical protein